MALRKKKSSGGQQDNSGSDGGFLGVAFEQMNPELLGQMAASNPDFVFGLLGSMDPGEMANAVNNNPEAFLEFTRALPREMLPRLLREQPDLMAEMVRNVNPDLLMEIMGNMDG